MKRFVFLLVGLLMVTGSLMAETPQYVDDDSQHVEYQMEALDFMDAQITVINMEVPNKNEHIEVIKDYNSQSISTSLISLTRNKHRIKTIEYDNPQLKTLNSYVYDTAIPPDLYGNRLI